MCSWREGERSEMRKGLGFFHSFTALQAMCKTNLCRRNWCEEFRHARRAQNKHDNKAIEQASGWEERADGAELFINARSWSLRRVARASWKVSSGSVRFNPLGARRLLSDGSWAARGSLSIRGHSQCAQASLKGGDASFLCPEEVHPLPWDSRSPAVKKTAQNRYLAFQGMKVEPPFLSFPIWAVPRARDPHAWVPGEREAGSAAVTDTRFALLSGHRSAASAHHRHNSVDANQRVCRRSRGRAREHMPTGLIWDEK